MASRLKRKEFVRNHCPDIRPLRQMLSRYRLKELAKYDGILPLARGMEKNGDMTPEDKKTVVSECAARWPEAVKRTERRIDELLRNSAVYRERAEDEALRTDMLYSYFVLGFQPLEYIEFALEGRPVAERRTFVSDRQRYTYHARMNDLAEAAVFTDKYKTYLRFRPWFNRDAVPVSGPGDRDAFLAFVEKHPVFVKKDAFGSLGKQVSLVDTTLPGNEPEKVFREMAAGRFLCEERVIQGEETARFNRSSLNCIRFYTALTRHGVEYPSCFFRAARSGVFGDGGHHGGVRVGVDPLTGEILTDAVDNDGKIYTAHPDSGVVFKGYRLPDWEGVLRLGETVAKQIPKVKLIGWDFAWSDKGWLVIEGNPTGQIGTVQGATLTGIRAQLDALMADMDLMV